MQWAIVFLDLSIIKYILFSAAVKSEKLCTIITEQGRSSSG